MKPLPKPREKLGGCIWLPRIIAKARQLARGELPPEYVARFGQPNGVDGQFLGFFGLTREQIVEAAVHDDPGLIAWFRAQPAVNDAAIARWNEIAVNLGRSGYPMAERLPVALSTTYAHLAPREFATVFEVLEADEA